MCEITYDVVEDGTRLHLPELEADHPAVRAPLRQRLVFLVVWVRDHRVLPLSLVVRIVDLLRPPGTFVFGLDFSSMERRTRRGIWFSAVHKEDTGGVRSEPAVVIGDDA